jgi:hypothetical protein
MLRPLATIVLLCFVLVLSAGALHAHGGEIFKAEHIEQCHHDEAHDACALCDVTKDVHTAIVFEHHVVIDMVGTAHEPLIANMVSDRCPLQQPGRAPPTTI